MPGRAFSSHRRSLSCNSPQITSLTRGADAAIRTFIHAWVALVDIMARALLAAPFRPSLSRHVPRTATHTHRPAPHTPHSSLSRAQRSLLLPPTPHAAGTPRGAAAQVRPHPLPLRPPAALLHSLRPAPHLQSRQQQGQQRRRRRRRRLPCCPRRPALQALRLV